MKWQAQYTDPLADPVDLGIAQSFRRQRRLGHPDHDLVIADRHGLKGRPHPFDRFGWRPPRGCNERAETLRQELLEQAG